MPERLWVLEITVDEEGYILDIGEEASLFKGGFEPDLNAPYLEQFNSGSIETLLEVYA